MGPKSLKFEVVQGETEHITYAGKRIRRPTVLIRVGYLSISKRAFLLGLALLLCQALDGVLTWLGLRILGIHMEGNAFLRELMYAYGTAPVLFSAKLASLVCVGLLTFFAHRRRWIRPLIGILIAVYLALAVIPWTVVILRHQNSVGSPAVAPDAQSTTHLTAAASQSNL
ncbi:MAG: DUF5658 family protein [Oligoflexia bacterium]|nr:DUF5658 family protein [Oligoflexia bacterium]